MVRVVASLMVALAALLPVAAEAHGPSRQKVVSKIEINAPVDKVWAAVGNFQDMSWHPAVAKTEGTGGNDVGATRKLTLQSGGVINEKLTKYSAEERGLAYEITDVDVKVLPVTNYSAQLNVSGTAEKTIVEWRAAFYRGFVNNDPPPELSDEAAVKAVTDIVQGGLGALKKKFEGG
ncbi:MAG: SRPBCC family protein [Hyphomicrobium sp.]|jgi:Polyketide cyclase / dehydrase and lipid transport